MLETLLINDGTKPPDVILDGIDVCCLTVIADESEKSIPKKQIEYLFPISIPKLSD